MSYSANQGMSLRAVMASVLPCIWWFTRDFQMGIFSRWVKCCYMVPIHTHTVADKQEEYHPRQLPKNSMMIYATMHECIPDFMVHKKKKRYTLNGPKKLEFC